jgi:DNA repair ATPase RecN
MKFNKIILPTILMAGALAVGSIGVHLVSAQESSTYPQIVIKLSEKFNLDKDEVMNVFEEEHADKEALRLNMFEERLDKAVTNGKITAEQKTAILEKHEEMRARIDEIRSQDLSSDEIRTQMDSLHEEVKNWATEQGISISEIMPLARGGHMKGARGERHMMWK